MFRILPRCRLIYISQNHVVSSRLKIGIWSDVLSLCVDDALMSSIRSSISSRTKQCWIVWRGMCVRPPRDVEAIADCSRRSFNRSVLPTKAATYESRFTIHRPTRMDSMTNKAAIQMIHTITLWYTPSPCMCGKDKCSWYDWSKVFTMFDISSYKFWYS